MNKTDYDAIMFLCKDIVNNQKKWLAYAAENNTSAKRINSCQAWFYDFDSFQLIKSYETIVAIYIKSIETLISFGRYSMTTYQHVRKYRNNYTPNMHNTLELNLELVNWFK